MEQTEILNNDERKKYAFTGKTKIIIGEDNEKHILHQIVALKDFETITANAYENVKKGDLGGYIESEHNLSQEGQCWINGDTLYDSRHCKESIVYGNARIEGNAYVGVNVEVYGNARIYDNALIGPFCKIYGNAQIYDSATVSKESRIYDNAKVYGNASVYSKCHVYENAKVYGNTDIAHRAKVFGNAEVFGSSNVKGGFAGGVEISGESKVEGNAEIYNNVEISGKAYIYENAKVYGERDKVTQILADEEIGGTTVVHSKEENRFEKGHKAHQDYLQDLEQFYANGGLYKDVDQIIEKISENAIYYFYDYADLKNEALHIFLNGEWGEPKLGINQTEKGLENNKKDKNPEEKNKEKESYKEKIMKKVKQKKTKKRTKAKSR